MTCLFLICTVSFARIPPDELFLDKMSTGQVICRLAGNHYMNDTRVRVNRTGTSIKKCGELSHRTGVVHEYRLMIGSL